MHIDTINKVRCVYDKSNLKLSLKDNSSRIKNNDIITDGILECGECGRIYPIIDEIAFIAEDELIESIDKVKNMREGKNYDKQYSDHKKFNLLIDVQSFWNKRPTGGKYNNEKEQFEGLEKWRIDSHPWLEELAGYNNHKGETILEVGGGQGLCTKRFANGGAFVVSIDLSYDSLLIAQRRHRYSGLSNSVDLILGNAENLPFFDEQFSFVYSYGVIHHSANTFECIKEISRVLRISGNTFVMYYYTWSFTKVVEGTAKFIYKIIKRIFKKDIAFRKLVVFLTPNYSDRHVNYFKNTGQSATLHAPVIKSFSKRQSRKMFSVAGFTEIDFTIKHLSEELAYLLKKIKFAFLIPWIEKHWGWDLIIRAKKNKN